MYIMKEVRMIRKQWGSTKKGSMLLITAMLFVLLSVFATSSYAADEESNLNGDAVESPLQLNWSSLDELNDHFSRSVAYGSGTYVMPAVGGNVKTSKDGLSWKTTYTGYPVDFSLIIWGKNQFVGFRQEAQFVSVWTSKDGLAWEKSDQPIHISFPRSAAWNGKRYVVVGGTSYDGQIFSSEDAVKWTERKTGIETNFTGVAWGNQMFVAQGYEGGITAVSKDGITWKKVKTNQPNFEQIWNMTYGGGAFVAVGDATIMTSRDGQKWSFVSSNVFWSSVHWVKDRFYITGFEYVDRKKHILKQINWSSKDGKNWSDAGFVSKPEQYPYVTLHNGKQYVTITDAGIQTSSDGRKWKLAKQHSFQIPTNVYGAAVNKDRLVIVGGNRSRLDFISISSQGSARMNTSGKWASAQVKQTFPLRDVIWSGQDFFAVGDDGKMMSSVDGLTWKNIKSPTTRSLTSVIYSRNTYYVAGEAGTILSSKDRKTWKTLNTKVKKKINAMASDGKALVAVGDNGLLLASQDGVTWNEIRALFPGHNYDITWGDGKFVVTTASYYGNASTAVVLTSVDGLKWVESGFPDQLYAHGMETGFFGIAHAGGLFIAVGSEGSIFVSRDAKKWTKQEVLSTEDWYQVAEFGGKIYVFGNTGKIVAANLP
jgi:hypothetical protein